MWCCIQLKSQLKSYLMMSYFVEDMWFIKSFHTLQIVHMAKQLVVDLRLVLHRNDANWNL